MVSHTRLLDFTSYNCFSIVLLPYFYEAVGLAPVFFTTAAWDGVYEILGHVVFCWGLDNKDIFPKSRVTHEYCSVTDSISFESFWLVLWHRTERLGWVFGYWSLSFDSDFLKLMLYPEGSCHGGGWLLSYVFLLQYDMGTHNQKG